MSQKPGTSAPGQLTEQLRELRDATNRLCQEVYAGQRVFETASPSPRLELGMIRARINAAARDACELAASIDLQLVDAQVRSLIRRVRTAAQDLLRPAEPWDHQHLANCPTILGELLPNDLAPLLLAETPIPAHGAARPHWSELTALQREILQSLGPRILSGETLAGLLPRQHGEVRRFDNIKNQLSELRRWSYLAHKRASGYSLAEWPPGTPDEVREGFDGHAAKHAE